MIVNFLNKIYVDTNVPDILPGTSGEHLLELYTGYSKGYRLNKKVIIIKPKTPLNDKVYDILPVGVQFNIVNQESLYGVIVRIIIWTASGSIYYKLKRHFYTFLRYRINKIQKRYISSKQGLTLKIISLIKIYINSGLLNSNQYSDKKEVSNGVGCELSDSDIHSAESFLKNIGVDYTRRIVCLHLRDHASDTDGWNRRCYIDQYEDGIKYLESKDMLVIKIGRNSEKKYCENSVVDLAFDDVPHVVQIYLISICEFVVSYETGVVPMLSYMFNKPLLMLNAVDPILNYPTKKNSLFILKTLFNNDNSEAAFGDIVSGRVTELKKRKLFNETYYYKDNTPSEILLSLKNMIYFIDNDFVQNSDQLFLKQYLQDKNNEILKYKKNIGVYNYHMRWSGCDFIGAGSMCAWYANKVRAEIESL